MAKQQDIAQVGETIGGRYVILGVLGEGGFGVVYQARSLEHDREFALKTYLKSALDRRAIARFRQESEIWIALGMHPYIVQAHFADEIDGRLYVGMELITPGPSGHNDLDSILKETSPALEQWLRWGVELCYGMEYAALRGIRAHRDLKPANVMINAAGHVKINDFGLATQPVASLEDDRQQLSKEVFRGQTMHGVGFGTPTHMPPEQFSDASACDARSDMYSFGVILYQAMAGELPVTVPSPTDASLESRLQFWNDMEAAHRAFEVPELGSPLDDVLRRCLATAPEDRYPDFEALRTDLERIQRSHGFAPVEQPMVRPLSAKGWLARGRSLARIGRFRQAIHAFEKTLELAPETELGLMGKADALVSLGRPTDAQPLYDAILQARPDHALACAGKARCLHLRGYLREALDLFDKATELDATDPDIWMHRGLLLRAMEDGESAMQSLERALELDRGHVRALTAKASALAASGQDDDALILFERALSINPLHAPAARGQAVCLVHQGHYARALSLFQSLERAGDLEPRHHLAWIEALSRSGEPARALTRLEKLIVPDLADEVDCMRPQVLVDLNQVDDALAAWSRLALGSMTDVLRVQGQVFHLLCGLEPVAMRLSAVPPYPAESAHDWVYGAACGAALHSGQDAYALGVCEQGLAHHPDSPLLHYNRGMALAVLNRIQEAVDAFVAAYRSDTGAIAEAAASNAETLCRIHGFDKPLLTQDDRKGRGSTVRYLLSDDMLPSRPLATLRIQANGWHPRYRVPHLRSTLYLFPRYLPADLAG